MNRIVKLTVNSLFMILLIGGSVGMVPTLVCALDIPAEPGQEKILMRYMKPQMRAFIIVYDLDGDGKGDYMTQRNIGQNYAMISQYPIYYGIDLDGDGQLDKSTEVFIDPQQDGLNGNEMGLVEWEKLEEGVEG